MEKDSIQIFKNEEFGDVRTVYIGHKIYFVANDVAKALGYRNTRDAVTRHCKGVVKHDILTKGGQQAFNIIPEGDVYRLIVCSKLPTAEKFELWVFDEVLPSIRKTGTYQLYKPDSYMIENPIERAKRWVEEQESHLKEIKERDNTIIEMTPKVEFFNKVTSSKDAVDMATVAKVLNYPNLGRNKLFEFLRQHKVLRNNNQPYQKYIDKEQFRVIVQHYMLEGEECVNFKTVVYPAGIAMIKKLLDEQFSTFVYKIHNG